jgi:hypothetical protein
MKTKHLLLALLMIILSGNSMAQKQLFDRFSDMEGVTSVYISKAMLQMMPNMKIQGGMDVGDFAGKLTGILILTSENSNVTKMMRNETASFHKNPDYEVLMKVKDEDSNVDFYIKKKSDRLIGELVMLVDDKDEFVIIQMSGNLTMEDIQKLTKGMH